MTDWVLIMLGVGAVAVCAVGVALVVRRTYARSPSDVVLQILGRCYARVFHGLRLTGRAHIPSTTSPGPLIVVANHTAGVDPILVSACCPFRIRWVMAQDMRLSWLEWLWKWQRVIFVSRSGQDRRAVREALAHLEGGGVIGIFPEGGLERPPRQIRQFRRGIGLLIHRSRAPVLPLVIEGTPSVDPAWASLWRPGRARVQAHPVIDYAGTGLTGPDIALDLRRRYLDWTGWAPNDRLKREADVTHPPPVRDDGEPLAGEGAETSAA